ncbi:Nucleotidyl transferase [Ignisphaera aggregans DSM 17230]|uniref:Nucleotidyl transferase n=1 Tax=Ignisphaera aggregans (strain DSM 17230 / JCM 13409 / AQ1.S1) TaxID=583356 RepID=E0SR76_IGNAA|nr:Nucleotidyl transferase [Ignisphaera aggregans DSM 17230]
MDSDRVIGVILAGGEGSRFRPYTDMIPKPMIPIGIEEKPILEHIVCWLKRFNINRFVFLVGYKWKQIRNYFGNGERFGVSIRYSVDSDEYRGTGGALLNAYKKNMFDTDILLIWYGDIIAQLDVKDLIKKHIESNSDAVIALADRYQVPVGVAEVVADRVTNIVEKPWLNIYVSIAILTLDPKVLSNVEEYLGKSFDIMGDLIPWMLKRNYKVSAYIYRGPWYDIGSFERYKKIDCDLIKGFLEGCSY